MKKIIIALMGLSFLMLNLTNVLANHHAVKIAVKDGVGSYLTDAKGMTLYWFKKDSLNQSVCKDGCLGKWPAFYRKTVAPPTGIDAKDFSTITRPDGQKQTTFRGYPLYYFFKDNTPKDTTGQGVKGVWYVIDPAYFPVN